MVHTTNFGFGSHGFPKMIQGGVVVPQNHLSHCKGNSLALFQSRKRPGHRVVLQVGNYHMVSRIQISLEDQVDSLGTTGLKQDALGSGSSKKEAASFRTS